MRWLRPLLAGTQGFTQSGLALDAFAKAQRPQHLGAVFAGIAFVGIDVGAGVALIEHVIKVRAVMLAGCARFDLADELVAHIHADAQLVVVVALAVLFGMGGVQVLLSALGRAPVLRDPARIELGPLVLGEVLNGRADQGGVDDLPAARQIAMA